jgi:hypothetical protein
MEQYLRACATYEQDNWVDLRPLAEFAYNNSVPVITRHNPFFANYGYHPEMHFKLPLLDARFRSETAADERLGMLEAARDKLRDSILEAQARRTRYVGSKEMVFEVGDKVWLSARHIQTARSSKMLDYKRLGPFKMTKVIKRNAYRLELPNSMEVHNGFHVSLLDRYARARPRTATQRATTSDIRRRPRRRRMGGRTHPRFTQAVPQAVVAGAVGRV